VVGSDQARSRRLVAPAPCSVWPPHASFLAPTQQAHPLLSHTNTRLHRQREIQPPRRRHRHQRRVERRQVRLHHLPLLPHDLQVAQHRFQALGQHRLAGGCQGGVAAHVQLLQSEPAEVGGQAAQAVVREVQDLGSGFGVGRVVSGVPVGGEEQCSHA